MDEDIRFQLSVLCLSHTGGTTRYWTCPYRCTFRDLIAVAGNSDPGDTPASVTVNNHSDTKVLGASTFGTDIAVGAKGTWVAGVDSDYVCAEGDILSFVVVAAVNTDIIELLFELDPKCRAA